MNTQISRLEAKKRASALRVKKLFVLCGMLVEQHREQQKNALRAATSRSAGGEVRLSAFITALIIYTYIFIHVYVYKSPNSTNSPIELSSKCLWHVYRRTLCFKRSSPKTRRR